MCGIVGYVGHRSAQDVVVEGLRRLEYRGYDSAGIALVDAGRIEWRKRAGKLANLEKEISEEPLPDTTIGIGHTRWATHGAPNDRNAHPHLGHERRVAVVHNGIIENFDDLRARLEDDDHQLVSETDTEVAEYWRENYDLTYIMRRDWATLGPKLEGKLHIYVGEMDNYYLNNAVYLAEEFLESTTDPYYGGEVTYGARDEHCWNGDPTQPNAISRLRYIQMFAPRMVERMMANHPAGADLTSWRY